MMTMTRMVLSRSAFIAVLLLCMVGITAADDYVGGLPLTTVQTGTVTGDLYISGTPPSTTFSTTVDRTFTLPAAAVAESGRIKWARLYVSAYCGHMQDAKAITYTTKVDWNNDATWDTTWTETDSGQVFTYMQGGDYNGGGNDNSGFTGHGTEEPYLMLNDHTTRVTSDYLSWYDVKDLIQIGQPAMNVNVVGGGYDGRIKVVTLVVAYDDPASATQTTYWVNEGHDACTYYTEENENTAAVGTTTFDTTGVTGITSATLIVDYMASNNGYYGFPTAANDFTYTGGTPPVEGTFTNVALDREADAQGPYSGRDSWDATSSVTGSGPVTLGYARYFPGTGTAAFYKIPLALLVVKSPVATTSDVDLTISGLVNTVPATAVFAKEPNTISVTNVKNQGTDPATSIVVKIYASDVDSGTTAIAQTTIDSLAAGGTKTLTGLIDPTIRISEGGSVTYTAKVDPDNLIAETNEANNIKSSVAKTVKYNGYKGKRYWDYGSDGLADDITTKLKYDLKGDIVYYTQPDSFYRGVGWSDRTEIWTAADLPVPAGATVEKVLLFFSYNWDQTAGGYPNLVTTFNGKTISLGTPYRDWSNFGTYADYEYGLYPAFDVTSLFVKNSDNMLVTTPGNSGADNQVALYPSTLLVIYRDSSETRKQVFINEEFDYLGVSAASYATTMAEATAYVPFSEMTIDTGSVQNAKWHSFATNAGPAEGNLIFNGNTIATNAFTGTTMTADAKVFDVTSYLTATGNEAGIQGTESGGMGAIQQILVVEYTNAAPLANAQTVTTAKNTAKDITLVATDADGDTLTYSVVSGPGHGTLGSISATGVVTYTPTTGYTGSDSFTFKANDGTVDSNTATVSITVNAVNTAPVANAQTVTTTKNTAKDITLVATDADGDTLTYSVVSGPSHGTVGSITSAGVVTYTPTTGYSGSDSFTFKVYDGTVYSNEATVTITVSNVNVAPVASDQSVSTTKNTAKDITLVATDADGDTLTYSVASGPNHGTVGSISATGVVTYTPTTGYTGSDSFTFKVNDGTVDSSTATISITVSTVNSAPVANGQSVITDEDTAIAITLSVTDVDGDSLTYSVVSEPSSGTLTGTAPSLTYTPYTGFTGSDSFTFKAYDGTTDSNTATVSITVNEVMTTPDASFTADPDSGAAPLTVAFTDTSAYDPILWAWDFDDGATSDKQNPVHTFTEAGTYTVKLTASNLAGSDDATAMVTVTETAVEPTAAFTTSIDGLTVTFTDQSSGTEPFTYAWDFGDGLTSDTVSPSHTYASGDTYTVTLTVTNDAGSDTASEDVTVTDSSAELAAAFTADVTSGESPLKVTFTDESTGSPAKWFWTFGDGETSMKQNPVHTYTSTKEKSYTVTLTIANPNGRDTEIKTKYITIAPHTPGAKPEAAFTADITTGESPLKVTFMDKSTGNPAKWFWTFGDGATSTKQNPVRTYTSTKEKSYTVTLTVTNANGKDTEVKPKYITITSGAKPEAVFTADVTTGESPLKVTFTDASTGSPAKWFWTFGDGTTSTKQNPVHTYTSTKEKSYTVTLTVTNANGKDTEVKTKYITVTPGAKPEAAFTADVTTGESPLKVTFMDKSTGSPTKWFWTFGDGATSTKQNPVHTYSSKKEKSYTVTLTVTNANGKDTEIETKYITVTPGAKPEAAFTADVTTGESPLKVTFTDQSTGTPTKWLWTFGDGATSTKQNPVHTYTSAKEKSYTVTLTVTNANGVDMEIKKRYITVG